MRKALYILIIPILFLVACAPAQTTAPTIQPTQASSATSATSPTSSPAPATKPSTADTYPAPQTTGYPAPQVQPTDASYPAPQTTTATLPPTYPVDTTSGIAIVDKVLKAALAADHSGLPSLVHYSKLACTQKDGPDGPPKCLAGEAEGTLVEVLPSMGVEGGPLRKTVTAANFPGKYALLAVFDVKSAATHDPNYPDGKYAAVFSASPDGQPPSIITLRIDDQGIVRLDSETALSDKTVSQAADFILPLKTK